jgi:hypothetical protein
MRARQRHFNPKTAGATLVLDARFLTASNDDAIGTWTSRTGINDATQATAASKPTYKVNMSGGQPALYFDGNDLMGFASSIISGTPDGFATFIYKVNADPATDNLTSGAPLGDFGSAILANHWPWMDGNIYDDFGTTSRKTAGNPTPSLASFRLISQHSAANDFVINIDGVQFYSTATNTVGWSGTQKIGGTIAGTTGGLPTIFLLGHIGLVIFAPLRPAASLRKRIEHSAAFSFKLACS